MTQVKDNITKLIPFVKTVSGKSAPKAILSMARMLNSSLLEAGIDIDAYIKDYWSDEIFDPSCLLGNHNNLFAFVQKDYIEFSRIMFEARPVGLGTPNAMVGECEFMALFCSPRVGISKKKNKGDITVDGKTIELKGTQLRFFSPKKTTGKAIQNHAKTLSAKYKVLPNKAGVKGDQFDFQPWGNCEGNNLTHKGKVKKDKLGRQEHWIAEFNKLGTAESCKYLSELCNLFIDCNGEDFAVCFDKSGRFNQVTFQFILVKKMFKGMEKKWDAFTQINNDRVISITDDSIAFANLIDQGKITMAGSFFRSNQDLTVGLYVKLC